LLFENYGQEVGGPINCWSPKPKVGGPVSHGPYGCFAYDGGSKRPIAPQACQYRAHRVYCSKVEGVLGLFVVYFVYTADLRPLLRLTASYRAVYADDCQLHLSWRPISSCSAHSMRCRRRGVAECHVGTCQGRHDHL